MKPNALPESEQTYVVVKNRYPTGTEKTHLVNVAGGEMRNATSGDVLKRPNRWKRRSTSLRTTLLAAIKAGDRIRLPSNSGAALCCPLQDFYEYQ